MFYIRIKEMIGRHYRNLENFNEVLSNVFDVALVLPHEKDHAHQMTLDLFIDMHTFDPNYTRFKWATRGDNKSPVIKYIANLIKER